MSFKHLYISKCENHSYDLNSEWVLFFPGGRDQRYYSLLFNEERQLLNNHQAVWLPCNTCFSEQSHIPSGMC